MTRRAMAVALMVTAMAAGCADGPTDGQVAGTAAGAGAGSGIGRAAAIGTHYPWAFAGAGFATGAALGSAIGLYLDPPPSRMWAAATIEAAETARPGQPVEWRLRDHHGRVTMIGDAWSDQGGRPCRALRQEQDDTDTPEESLRRDVVACKGGDGTWEVVLPSGEE